MRLGWYVHHQGSGHLALARAVVPLLAMEVTVFSSLPRPALWSGDWVQLPLDVGDDPDPTSRGALHWAPVAVPGYARRMRTLAEWIARSQPDAMMVDVSAEVVTLSRLLGVPTATIVLPGERTDRPHRLAFDLCDLLIGPWPAGAFDLPAEDAARLVAVGPITRFARRVAQARVRPGSVLLLCGAGGTPIDEDAVRAAEAATGRPWVARGGPWPASPDLWDDLMSAEVVVSFAGQGAVADVATARRPAVIVAAERPFGEQRATVRALRRLEVVPALEEWPSPERWPELLRTAREWGGDRWRRWAPDPVRGPARIAEALTRLAARA
ncbi:hypothetical protein [Nigerium massiliense]|uniref:hypothetical protein n=1 Tax=Nigerium massiliense TaxID=1522317 RepID=UPI00058B4DD3|nr:hypothetical protein [Nigerium massiliense]